jgi:hypothetical protein
MEYCLRLSHGMGNKIMALVYYLSQYPNDTLYVADQVSVHQKGLPHEKIYYLYPELLKHPNLKFISFNEYLKIKETMPKLGITFSDKIETIKKNEGEIIVSWNSIFDDGRGFKKTSIRKYFKPNTELDYLKKKYDFDKGMFVHFRLGDKFRENMKNFKEDKPIGYILMKPQYYLKYLNNFSGPVYIFSDEIEVAKCLLKDDRFEYTDEGTNEAIYCFQNAKHMIVSESTMSIVAMKLNSRKYQAIVPGYLIRETVVVSTKYATESEKTHLETDKNLILSKKEDYIKIIKECHK